MNSEKLIGPIALLFDDVAAEPGERSDVLFQAIVLDSASYPLRQHTAMLCTRRHADEIRAGHSKQILARCLTLGLHPVDPYEPLALQVAARSAAAALLANHPALDEVILARLDSPEAALVFAAALQTRQSGLGDGMSAALAAMRPSEKWAFGFARDCNRGFSAVDPITGREGVLERARGWLHETTKRQSRHAWMPLRAAVAVGWVVVFVALALILDASVLDLPDRLVISTGSALAGLGILVTVHVLAAELSASRLAGPVARATSFPIPLLAGYCAGLAILVGSVAEVAEEHEATYGAIVVGLVASLVVAVMFALMTLLRRTDPVQAVVAFERRKGASVWRAGRILGRVQAEALRQRERLFGFSWSSNTLSPPLGVRQEVVSAPKSGFLLLRNRRLRRLSGRREYEQERLRLVTTAVLGTPISAGDQVFSLVPDSGVQASARDVGRVRGLLRIRPYRTIDAVAEYVGATLGVAVAQAQTGNQAGAERVRSATLSLLTLHLQAVREARGQREEDTIGLVPALRTAAVQGLRGLQNASDANTREIVLGFLQRLLPLTDRADSFSATLLAQLQGVGGTLSASLRSQLLWACAVQAIKVDDRLGIQHVRTSMGALLGRSDQSVDIGGRIVQYATAAQPFRAEGLWEWHEERCGDEEIFRLTAIRIGATALIVGHAALALRVALHLRDEDVEAWIAYFDEEKNAEEEKIRDELYGQLLGPDPQAALQTFLRFLGGAAPAIAQA